MSFTDSCVKKLAPYGIREEATRLPEGIFPVYIGSGSMTMSVDASGMQGLNHGMEKAFTSAANCGDLYVVRHGRTSDHIDPMNVLPYGYFTWNAELSDMIVSPETLPAQAAMFRRELDLEQGLVKTSMLLNKVVDLAWELCMPLHTNCLMMRLTLDESQFEKVHNPTVHTGTMQVRLHLQSRAGKALYDKACLRDNVLHLEVQGTEAYVDDIRFEGSVPLHPALEDDTLVLTFEISTEQQVYTLLIDFDNQHGIADLSTLLDQNVRSRRKKFAGMTQFEGLDLEELYLYHNTQYLLMSCYRFDMGLPIGMPFFFPWCWKTGTFWDSHFVMDALMRMGGREEADSFLRYLFRVMRPEGKPFPWMFDYLGRSCVKDSEDVAPLCMCAHAMTGIRHYEYFRDRTMLEELILPMLERISSYAARTLYSRENGAWIMAQPVSNDVVDLNLVEVNQTFTTIWFLVVFAKTVEYQKMLGREPDALLEDIVANHRIEKDENEYYHSKNTRVPENSCGSWVPFLCYPSEGMPFLDLQLFSKTREKYSFVTEYMNKQSSYQPWTEFMEAMSDFRRGAPEAGFALRRRGLSHAFGVGYFSEVGPCMETCGLPPYISAHGTFMTSLADQFILPSIWDQTIKVFAGMPQYYWNRSIRIENMICNGVRILEARINGYETVVTMKAVTEDTIIQLLLKVPNGAGVSPCVKVNGQKVEALLNEEARTVQLDVPVTIGDETAVQVF